MQSGQPRWVRSASEDGAERAVVMAPSGHSYVGGYLMADDDRASSVLTALDTVSGRHVWRYVSAPGAHFIDTVLHTLLSPDARTVYAVGVQALPGSAQVWQRSTWRVTAHDAASGRIRWSWSLPGVNQASVTAAALPRTASTWC